MRLLVPLAAIAAMLPGALAAADVVRLKPGETMQVTHPGSSACSVVLASGDLASVSMVGAGAAAVELLGPDGGRIRRYSAPFTTKRTVMFAAETAGEYRLEAQPE